MATMQDKSQDRGKEKDFITDEMAVKKQQSIDEEIRRERKAASIHKDDEEKPDEREMDHKVTQEMEDLADFIEIIIRLPKP